MSKKGGNQKHEPLRSDPTRHARLRPTLDENLNLGGKLRRRAEFWQGLRRTSGFNFPASDNKRMSIIITPKLVEEPAGRGFMTRGPPWCSSETVSG